jgi:ABC-type oligopeptide transport system ATPase subunit
MNIENTIKLTNDLIFAKTGKDLDSLQMAILQGVWEGQEYQDIANNYRCSKDHVRKEASELWKILSDVLGKDVKKSNVKAVLETAPFSFSNIQIGDQINFCNNHCPYPQFTKNTSNNIVEKKHDLTYAPKTSLSYDYHQEIDTLKQWILQDQIPIISLIGLSGSGKSILASELVRQIQNNFDRVIWRNCNKNLLFSSLKTNLTEFISTNSETPSSSLIQCLQSHRCLIILDDFQELFITGKLAGSYYPEQQDYSDFLKKIAHTNHNSCLILISQEKPVEIATWEMHKGICKTLQMPGLGQSDSQKILKDMKLKDENRWSELIAFSSGYPLWLEILAHSIDELFNGSVDQFLSTDKIFLGDLENILHKHYIRLSDIEKQAISWFATQPVSVNISSYPNNLTLSKSDFCKAVKSLLKRCLLQKVNTGQSLFTLPSAIREYIKNLD